MNAPKEGNEAILVHDDEEAAVAADAAAAARFDPPREISFRESSRRSNGIFHEDDNTIPSELSTLIAPSTLTPNYDPNFLGYSYNHHSGSGYGEPTSDHDSFRSNRAFQLAGLLGLLSIGTLFGADVAYMFLTSSSQDVGPRAAAHHVSSSKMNMDALDLEDSSPRSRRGGPKEMQEAKETSVSTGKNGEGDGGEEEEEEASTKKKAKASKTKAAKRKTKAEDDEEEDYDDEDEDEEEVSQLEDDDYKRIATITQRQTTYDGPNIIMTPDMIDASDAKDDDDGSSSSTVLHGIPIPQAHERCPYVIETFQQLNEDVTNADFLRQKYRVQSTDPNVFYRATALHFWKDFGARHWGRERGRSVRLDELVSLAGATYEDGAPVSPMSTWTWITGDQHLSNFGAWRNRGGEVVFSVNDFDEAAIYDFQLDVLRIAVSICSHGFTNGFNEGEVREALEAFTFTYVKTAVGYVGGDAALVYELNEHTSTGVLRDFLRDVGDTKSRSRQMHKFTELDDDGVRRFVRNDVTRLEDVPPVVEEKIRAEMTSTRYGASMMKMGWKVRGWDDDFFTVLDVARRVGSGVGSYGVDRFYVLLKGEDSLLEEDHDGASLILDVKYEPVSAVSRILEESDADTKAWYGELFRNEADRAVEAQTRLTSYTDPYVGYLVIDGNSYNVRQRSPYKSSFDLDTLTNRREFNEFMEQIAIATATAHVRGSVAKSPGQFKHVIKLLLAGGRNRRRWSELVAEIALSYRSQVLLDFECFKQYVETNFP